MMRTHFYLPRLVMAPDGIIAVLTTFTKWRNLLRHYTRLRSCLLRTTTGPRWGACTRTWFKVRRMTTVSLLWLISPIEAGFNRRSPDHGRLVYSFDSSDEKGRRYPRRRMIAASTHDKISITYNEKVDIMREHAKPGMIYWLIKLWQRVIYNNILRTPRANLPDVSGGC